MRIKPYECVPDRWFFHGTIEHSDGSLETVITLHLPSWGMFYDYAYDRPQWGQRVLVWLGRRGFRISHRFPQQQNGDQ